LFWECYNELDKLEFVEIIVMKKIFVMLVCFMFTFTFVSCSGKISDAQIRDVDSEIYSSEDIASAIDVIKKEFKSEWKGCTLKEIYYAGDELAKGYQEYANENDADEAIILLSSFDVDFTGGDGSLNANSTYDDWMWILIRTEGGKWKHVDHGY
jgi:hypothetical protein